ncbi:NAD(P)H-dependent oxidoreductase subunit E [Acidisoma silvae]|uniref:NAD(P)H-dependent oxidoreductase subunit E n=1 Tax=Acidisoma silvae TaxID=2802396 RepID=A0A963YSC6_9PROT|nr:NAD(P)H-dependent oxidoreductase subunit E [Acidisoma silvae]
MSSSHVAEVAEPASFAFDAASLAEIEKILKRYPPERKASAVIFLLYEVQKQMARQTNSGWVPRVGMDVVAAMLDMAPIRVYEVATFYTMFNLKPVGRYHLQVCTTTPCWLRGSDEVVAACFKKTGLSHFGEVSADGLFSMAEVECLGACVNAPMMQVNNENYYEDLDGPRTEALLDAFRRGEPPAAGPTINRLGSQAEGGPTTLTHAGEFWSPEKYAVVKRERAEAAAKAAAEAEAAAAAAAANPPAADGAAKPAGA